MKAVTGFIIDTASYRFELTVFRNPRRRPRFVAQFVGTLRPEESGNTGRQQTSDALPTGTVQGFYLEKLIQQCRAAIDKIDGPILQMSPRKVAGSSQTQKP